jgi:PPM family protein phosphatase
MSVRMGEAPKGEATQVVETIGATSEDGVQAGARAIKPALFGMSDVGKVRKHNEDSFFVARLERRLRVYQSSRGIEEGAKVKGPPQGWIMIVADGMGGHAAGEVASAMAVDALARYVFTSMPWTHPKNKEESRALAHGLRNAVKRCQDQVRQAAESGAGKHGMGTTLTMAYVAWPDLFVVHVGDSRLYALRDAQLHQVTRDHTLAQQLVDSKVMSAAEAETSDFSNILVNAVGGDSDELKVELHHAQLFPGDVLMLCSDGLTKHVSRDRILEELTAVHKGKTPEDAAQILIDDAKTDGGTDNVTVVIARF